MANLLDLSRIEAGALKPAKEWEDVGELCSVLPAGCRRSSRDGRSVPGGQGRAAGAGRSGSPRACRCQSVENALKYSADGEPVEITVSRRAGAVSIAVQDHGIGIPLDEQAKIFETFYRIAGTGRRTGGTGMGLSIVKGLIEANGGRIEVTSPVEGGSVFTILLPEANESATSTRSEVTPSERTQEAHAISGNRTV